jgi:hypothetical protein
MLSTINGFDLVLVIIIVIAGFKIYNLNRECESYVGQIIDVTWMLRAVEEKLTHHDECNCKDCYIRVQPPTECLYCLGIEEFVTGNECYCESF